MATEMGDKMESTIGPDAFINRELSWLQFNLRVLEEAENPGNPLMERLKFLAIFSSNLDEFFMVRVAGVREQALGESAPQDFAPDGMRAIDQLKEIAAYTQELVARQYRCLRESIGPAMAAEGFELLRYDRLSAEQLEHIDRFFRERALPILTPMAVDPAHPSPQYHNRGLYLGVMLAQRQGLGPKQMFAVVQVPQVLPRIVGVPGGVAGQTPFVLLEEVIAARLPELFGGFEVRSWTTFRITRDSDLELLEQESDDMLRLIEERLKARQRGQAVRIEISAKVDEALARMIIDDEGLHAGIDNSYGEVYRIDGPLDLTGLWELYRLPGFDRFHDSYFTPRVPRGLGRRGEDIFTAIAHGDILLHHPYDSFQPVVDFVEQAARDPQVFAIKQTFYRTSGDSPLVRALIEASQNGKQVTALVELKARFDEANNIQWAKQLEEAGVHVVYGLVGHKTHCKMCLVVRREGRRMRHYAHLGTGNYNPRTARYYTDLSHFTARADITHDVGQLFNTLTGFGRSPKFRHLLVAPYSLHRRINALIATETRNAAAGHPARIIAKMNSLVDKTTIDALYGASQAGVKIDLIVRGTCSLVPGVPGLSENIRVRSLVGRFLEHARAAYFENARGEPVILAGSADWMPRNFLRRVEVVFPIRDPALRRWVTEEFFTDELRDTSNTRLLHPNGTYLPVPRRGSERTFSVHAHLMAAATRRSRNVGST